MDIFTLYRDAAGRRVTDPAYDAHTLHIPADYMRKQTPGHKQWWMEKSKHFDAVIFFKVDGKSYLLGLRKSTHDCMIAVIVKTCFCYQVLIVHLQSS